MAVFLWYFSYFSYLLQRFESSVYESRLTKIRSSKKHIKQENSHIFIIKWRAVLLSIWVGRLESVIIVASTSYYTNKNNVYTIDIDQCESCRMTNPIGNWILKGRQQSVWKEGERATSFNNQRIMWSTIICQFHRIASASIIISNQICIKLIVFVVCLWRFFSCSWV